MNDDTRHDGQTGRDASDAGGAENAPVVRNWSVSRMNCFDACPRKYRYRYVEELASDGVSIGFFKGSAAHYALEYLYRSILDGRTPTRDEVVAEMRAWWDRESAGAFINPARRNVSDEDFLERAVQTVEAYYDAHAPFDEDETTDVECWVSMPLGEDGRFVGRVDRTSVRDGVVEIHDYKSGRRGSDHADMSENAQLALYALCLAGSPEAAAETRLVWHYLADGERIDAVHDADEYAELLDRTRDRARRIADETDFEPKRSRWCAWCEYADTCAAEDAAVDASRRPA